MTDSLQSEFPDLSDRPASAEGPADQEPSPPKRGRKAGSPRRPSTPRKRAARKSPEAADPAPSTVDSEPVATARDQEPESAPASVAPPRAEPSPPPRPAPPPAAEVRRAPPPAREEEVPESYSSDADEDPGFTARRSDRQDGRASEGPDQPARSGTARPVAPASSDRGDPSRVDSAAVKASAPDPVARGNGPRPGGYEESETRGDSGTEDAAGSDAGGSPGQDAPAQRAGGREQDDGSGPRQGGGRPSWRDFKKGHKGEFRKDFQKGGFKPRFGKFGGGGGGQGGPAPSGGPGPAQQPSAGGPPGGGAPGFQKGRHKKGKFRSRGREDFASVDSGPALQVGFLPDFEVFEQPEELVRLTDSVSGGGDPVRINDWITAPITDLIRQARELGAEFSTAPNRGILLEELARRYAARGVPLEVEGVLDLTEDDYGLLVYGSDNYKVRPFSTFVPESVITQFGLKRGHILKAQVHPPRDGETCPFLLKLHSVMGLPPEEVQSLTPFEDLVPYYPTERLLLETTPDVKWDNFSMRIVDLLTPIGKGQRGVIVAPPRTGKTILQQGIANAVAVNNPEAHLIVLLVDERPEEVTDFRRQVKRGEVIASTFDQAAESHVQVAEMVIEKARRMVEVGHHVIILLDSITRLARAYNTLAANSGKILSGGVEATALQKPKRFFGSARNIEGGGSLTILGTALVDTGSRMDEVIFEEFKGTGNMELHLERQLVDKRIFPAIALEKSGTRKEELLYHPDEMLKIYGLRRAMKGVPAVEAMEMLISRVRKTKTNAEFLIALNR